MTAPLYLLTIRPGPVLHLWRDGKEVAAVPMSRGMLECLVRDAFDAMWHTGADPVPHGSGSQEHGRG